MDIVLLDEVEEGLVSKQLRDFELVLVPALSEASLYIALAHVKGFPKGMGTVLADENSESHVEVGALVAAALDAVRVERIFQNELVKELSLLRRLSL